VKLVWYFWAASVLASWSSSVRCPSFTPTLTGPEPSLNCEAAWHQDFTSSYNKAFPYHTHAVLHVLMVLGY
jgi:hypothetical protein